jgi:hypothetical protein
MHIEYYSGDQKEDTTWKTCRWESNIKVDLKRIGCEVVN